MAERIDKQTKDPNPFLTLNLRMFVAEELAEKYGGSDSADKTAARLKMLNKLQNPRALAKALIELYGNPDNALECVRDLFASF